MLFADLIISCVEQKDDDGDEAKEKERVAKPKQSWPISRKDIKNLVEEKMPLEEEEEEKMRWKE